MVKFRGQLASFSESLLLDMSWIIYNRPLHAEIHYHVLSHLDLGCDAASIYRIRHQHKPWQQALTESYLRAPGRLLVQVLPLFSSDFASYHNSLRGRTFSLLNDTPGTELREQLASAVEQERETVERAWQQESDSDRNRAEETLSVIIPILKKLRNALWNNSEQSIPPLRIVDCTSLGDSYQTYGRSIAYNSEHLVAVSFRAPFDQLLCQIIHEEIHPVTDPPIRARYAQFSQDTRLTSPGFELHRQLERQAIQTGGALIERHAPELLAAYELWLRQYPSL